MPSPKKTVLLIGSGPIVIGQACEFDYSGTQALMALRKNGLRTVLINPNPATIMTDRGMADRTYLEPLTAEALERIIIKERPDCILPTMGGQTGLNLAMEAHRKGILKRHRVQLIGAKVQAIHYAEDRLAFRSRMSEFGLPLPKGFVASTERELISKAERIGYPLLLRTSYTLGGLSSEIIRSKDQLPDAFRFALRQSRHPQVLVEEFLEGWHEFELEVMRDRQDNCIVVCSIENVDSMGVHTGDSITVAPVQTLTDSEYQRMRQMAFACVRAVGVETGGANVQFARNPQNGDIVLIEMNPRVSRSSALASKATGVPIASIAAELALGKTLDQIPNAITGKTTAAFEPSLDYVVVKIPQFQLWKFDLRSPWLNTSMRSIGEAMAIGRTFPEALQKGMRSLEEGLPGLTPKTPEAISKKDLEIMIRNPNPYRLFYVKEALRRHVSIENAAAISAIHPWFIDQIKHIVDWENSIAGEKMLSPVELARGKRLGFSDVQIGNLLTLPPEAITRQRYRVGIEPEFFEVDTCAGEFEAKTSYFYSTYESSSNGSRLRKRHSKKKRYVVLGSGPNRIGEGLEFDYSCVHASEAIQEKGHEAILINSNPETVSTDHKISSRLYFEPVDFEEVENVLRLEKADGIILQFGGQQPLNLSRRLAQGGWPILGTPVKSIIQSEERLAFAETLRALDIPYPRFQWASNKDHVIAAARQVGFPILLRPSYVMGGDRIRVYKDAELLQAFLEKHFDMSTSFLVDHFLSQAVEVDIDAISDGRDVRICGILEQIEAAGIHSGDSSMIFPPVNLSFKMIREMEDYVRSIVKAFKIKGMCNLQVAICEGKPYVLELNARASRTVPFLSKATGVPWAKIATRILLGESLKSALSCYPPSRKHENMYYAKASAFCFYRFPGVSLVLGPEMRSTGETMGIAVTSEGALAKARLSAGQESRIREEEIHCLQDLC